MPRHISCDRPDILILGDIRKGLMSLLAYKVHDIINAYYSIIIAPHILVTVRFVFGRAPTRPLIKQLPLIKTLEGCENEKPLVIVSQVILW